VCDAVCRCGAPPRQHPESPETATRVPASLSLAALGVPIGVRPAGLISTRSATRSLSRAHPPEAQQLPATGGASARRRGGVWQGGWCRQPAVGRRLRDGYPADGWPSGRSSSPQGGPACSQRAGHGGGLCAYTPGRRVGWCEGGCCQVGAPCPCRDGLAARRDGGWRGPLGRPQGPGTARTWRRAGGPAGPVPGGGPALWGALCDTPGGGQRVADKSAGARRQGLERYGEVGPCGPPRGPSRCEAAARDQGVEVGRRRERPAPGRQETRPPGERRAEAAYRAGAACEDG
jgi:hypothetical protein